jgi:hypothetical protein
LDDERLPLRSFMTLIRARIPAESMNVTPERVRTSPVQVDEDDLFRRLYGCPRRSTDRDRGPAT